MTLMLHLILFFFVSFFVALEQDEENSDKHVTVTEAEGVPDSQV